MRTRASPSVAVSPTRRQRLPRVAAQACSRVRRRPIAAAATTWAIMPPTRMSPIVCSTDPRPSDPREPTSPLTSPLSSPESSTARERSRARLRNAVTTTGIAIATAATSTAEPTVAFGLKRMIRNAASYMSESVSGRSGTAPGLWAAPSIPGCGERWRTAAEYGVDRTGAAPPGGGGCGPGGPGGGNCSVIGPPSRECDNPVRCPRTAPVVGRRRPRSVRFGALPDLCQDIQVAPAGPTRPRARTRHHIDH